MHSHFAPTDPLEAKWLRHALALSTSWAAARGVRRPHRLGSLKRSAELHFSDPLYEGNAVLNVLDATYRKCAKLGLLQRG
jgi:hypothetical protein